jgi:hypothetical protein
LGRAAAPPRGLPTMPFLAPLLAVAATTALSPSLAATRASEPPTLNGRLDDAAWATAPPSDTFTQKFPRQGEAPSEHTTIRVLYDDDALYVGFDCEQENAAIVSRLTRRDRPIEADWVSFAVDSRMDGTTAFDFSVNVAGVLSDAIRFNDTDFSLDWDDNWDARTARTDKGWSAEFRIPLRILRFGNKPLQTWGFQARRHISMTQEDNLWAFIPRDQAREVSAYGKLTDLRGMRPNHGIELRPYVSGKITRTDESPELLDSGTVLGAAAGLDLKWHPTQELTLDVSVNPDFAQVEADQVILNLTPKYELLLPERRPFFLEGQDIFTTPLQLFYTRRIGRVAPSPSLQTDAPHDEKLTALPTPATIYGASKLIGRVAQGISVGIVNTLAARNNVVVADVDRFRKTRLAEPLTGFNVFRVKRDVGNNGHIGLLATSTIRAEDGSGYAETEPTASGSATHLCPNGAVRERGERCFHNAHVAGLDFRWRSPAGTYVVTGQAIGSTIDKGPTRTFADGTVVKPGDTDVGMFARIAKEGGKPINYGIRYSGMGKRLDFNDLGYMQRQNLHQIEADLGFRTVDPWWKTVSTETYVSVESRWSIDGLRLSQAARLGSYWQYDNFWETWAQLVLKPAWFDDREVGDGAALERAGRVGLDIFLGSDPRKPVRLELDASAEKIPGGVFAKAEAIITLRTLPQLDLQLLPQAVYANGEPRFAANGDNAGTYIFGTFQAANIGGTLRATYTFSPRLSFQTYAQMFLATGHYSNFSSYVTDATDPNRPRAMIRRRDLVASVAPSTNPDFVDAALNVNAVFRWEYRLGSTFFLVYTRTQSPRSDLPLNESAQLSLSALGRAPAADVLLAKFSYWWG